MKLLTVLGTRPQYIKAAMVSKALSNYSGITELIVDTGQHYDFNMSDQFIKELKLPKIYRNLKVGSGGHGAQTGHMLIDLELIMLKEKPDYVLVYGDTNSALAGALSAVKLRIPVLHIESGLRSFNPEMPEEHNRVMIDHISDILFTPTQKAEYNIAKENIDAPSHLVGDVMIDLLMKSLPKVKHTHEKNAYAVLTLHRAENTNDALFLSAFLQAFRKSPIRVIWPMHPRLKRVVDINALPSCIKVVDPQGYMDMLSLVSSAKCVFTDSGGLQKEACSLQVPVFTLREETEWVETERSGWNTLIGMKTENLLKVLKKHSWEEHREPFLYNFYYGHGKASETIAEMLSHF